MRVFNFSHPNPNPHRVNSCHLAALNVNDFMFEEHPELARVDDKIVGWGMYHIPRLMGTSPAHYADTVADARKKMKLFKAAEDALDNNSSGTLVFMHGKYSYPNGWGPEKVSPIVQHERRYQPCVMLALFGIYMVRLPRLSRVSCIERTKFWNFEKERGCTANMTS